MKKTLEFIIKNNDSYKFYCHYCEDEIKTDTIKIVQFFDTTPHVVYTMCDNH